MALCVAFAFALLGIPTFFCIIGLAYVGLNDAAPGIALTIYVILSVFLSDKLYGRFGEKQQS